MRRIIPVFLFLFAMIAIAFLVILNINKFKKFDNEIDYVPSQSMLTNDSPANETKHPTPKSDSETIHEVKDLYSRWVTALNRPGWFYVVEEVEQSPNDYGTLVKGTQIPEDYQMNTWYLLDGKGLVLASISTMKDAKGIEVQRVIFTGTVWHNLAVNEKWPGSPYMLDLDFGILETLSKGSEWYGELSISEATLDEREIIEVLSAKGNGQFSAMFDLVTGQPVGGCLKNFDVSGKLINFSCGKIVNMTWDEPPQELLLDLEHLSSQ